MSCQIEIDFLTYLFFNVIGKNPQYFFSQYIGKKDIGDFLAFELLKCGVEATESYGKKIKKI